MLYGLHLQVSSRSQSGDGPLQATAWQRRASFWVALGLIVGLAAFSRLYDLNFAQFKADEARAVSFATSIVNGESLPF